MDRHIQIDVLKDGERYSCCGETTTSSDISSSAERQVVQDRVHVDLRREHLKDWRQRQEVLDQSENGPTGSSLSELLDKERHEGDPEDEEDRDDASLDPRENRLQVVTAALAGKDITVRVVLAHQELLVERAEENEGEHEHLHRAHDKDVVDVETGVTIVEGEESIDRKLCAEVIVLSRQHLLSHTSADLRLEVENRAETKISSFSTLVVLGMLDATSTAEGEHTGKDIFVEMQALLRLRNTTSSVHVDGIEEIGLRVSHAHGVALTCP